MIVTHHVLKVACDNPECCAKDNLIAKGDRWVMADETTAKNYSQARMTMIRAGWKIRKNKALCPACVGAGKRMSDLNDRRKKPIAAPIENQPEGSTGSPVSTDGGLHATGVQE